MKRNGKIKRITAGLLGLMLLLTMLTAVLPATVFAADETYKITAISGTGGKITVKHNGDDVEEGVPGRTYNVAYTPEPGKSLIGLLMKRTGVGVRMDMLDGISSDFKPIFAGTSYDFTMPGYEVDICAIFTKYEPPATLYALSYGMEGKPFSYTLKSKGSERITKWEFLDDTMADRCNNDYGLFLDEETGIIRGTPKSSFGINESKLASFKATDIFGVVGYVIPDIVIIPPLTVNGDMSEGGGVFPFRKGLGDYSWDLSVDLPYGAVQCLWEIKEGTLPDGLELVNDASVTDGSAVAIAGTPTTLTEATVTVKIGVSVKMNDGSVFEATAVVNLEVIYNLFDCSPLLFEGARCEVPMTTANTKESAAAWLNNMWLPAVLATDEDILNFYDVLDFIIETDDGFSPAVAGTAADPDGTNGSVTFTVCYKNADGGAAAPTIKLCDNLTCTVKATEYVPHSHSFDKEVAENKYLKSRSNCKDAAVYYKSCECGESSKGTVSEATFKYGNTDPDNHSPFETYPENQKDATYDKKGYTGDTYCSGCDEELESGKEIAMKVPLTGGCPSGGFYVGANAGAAWTKSKVTFKAANGTNLPSDAKLDIKPHTPTEENVKLLTGADDVEMIENYTTTNADESIIDITYTVGTETCRPGDVVLIDGKKCVIDITENYEPQYFVIGGFVKEINKQMIVDGIAYNAKYEYTRQVSYNYWYYYLYTADGSSAGKLELIDSRGSTTGNEDKLTAYWEWINKGCDPKTLKEKQAGQAIPIAQITKDGVLHNVFVPFSNDIKLVNASGLPINDASGVLGIETAAFGISDKASYGIYHIHDDSYDAVQLRYLPRNTIDGKAGVKSLLAGNWHGKGLGLSFGSRYHNIFGKLSVGITFSPFIILAVEKAENVEIPVKVIDLPDNPPTGDNNISIWLWLSLFAFICIIIISSKKHKTTK